MHHSMQSITKTLLSMVLCTHLTACATNKEHFDCPHGKGVGCRSIREVNQMVNQGQLAAVKSVDQQPFEGSAVQSALLPEQLQGEVLVDRTPDRVIKIWFAPFQDEQGHFHEASTLYTVLKPGFWQMEAL